MFARIAAKLSTAVRKDHVINIAPWLFWLAACMTLAGHLHLAYAILRSDFALFIAACALLFVAFFGIYFLCRLHGGLLNYGIGLAVLARLCWIAAEPALSDDFYRFLWDGLLTVYGFNPYAVAPVAFESLSQLPAHAQHLLVQMNSPEYYSVYPPVLQYLFAFAAFCFPNDSYGPVILLRGIMLAAEVVTLWALYRLLVHFELPRHWWLLYGLNPLIIVELTGNLHPEAVMLACLSVALLLLANKRLYLSSIMLALAVSTKLTPLLVLPFCIAVWPWKQGLRYGVTVVVTCIFLFLPFYAPGIWQGPWESLLLYFRTFEFNAGLYYLARWAGYQWAGYNMIATIGPLLTAIFGCLYLFLAGRFIYKSALFRLLPHYLMGSWASFLLLSTTIHPWYMAPLLLLSVLTAYRFAVVWSLLLPLSYAAYQFQPYAENMWLLALQYVVVFGWMGVELLMTNYDSIRMQPGTTET